MLINDLRWVSINGYCLYDSFLYDSGGNKVFDNKKF